LKTEGNAVLRKPIFLNAKQLLPALIVALLLMAPALKADKAKDEETLRNAASVLKAMIDSDTVSPNILNRAACVVVLPSVKKGGFIVGGTGGRGPMVCRTGNDFTGKWSAPAMYNIGGASVGLQAGGSATDYVLLVMTPKGVNALLEGKAKLGGDASIAAGPTGASANTVGGNDVLSYGRSKGAFAGLSLGGATLEPDDDANKNLYGKAITAKEIVVQNSVVPTASGQQLVALLSHPTKSGN
jgi:lipid-binding SYLF domain-containing protein